MQTEEIEDLSSAQYYRPNMFDDQYIGNTNVKRSILNSIRSGKKTQVLLFYGEAGTGKTTAARIYAKYLRCENRTEEGHACNECQSCQTFNEYIKTGQEGYLEDFKEIDSTQAGKKEDIDALIEEATYAARASHRIYIFDECHSISPAGQNRLLKFLEEPPEDIVVFLCTTDPEKMLKTIVSRCRAKYPIQKPKLDELIPLLEYVCDERGYIYDRKALRLIATRNELAQRATLNGLDAIAREYNNNVTYENTVEHLQHVSDSFLIRFYDILLADFIRIDTYISHIGYIKENIGIRQFLSELINFTIRGIYVINGVPVAGLDEEEKKMYKKLFKTLNVMEIGSLLKRVITLANAKDKDAEILLLELAFVGIRNDRALNTRNNVGEVVEEAPRLLQADLLTAEQEQNMQDKNHKAKLTPTEKTIENFVGDKMTPVTGVNAIASFFGTSVIVEED